MYKYIFKRILLILPTLFIIMLVNFLIIQTAPGGPVERILANLNNTTNIQGEVATSSVVANLASSANNQEAKYNSAYGIDPQLISQIEKDYGFDKPLMARFLQTMKKFLSFDFGSSFYQDKKVTELLLEKLPVSISLGIWTTLIIYIVSIPLGIKKAVNDGTKFDITTSTIVIICNAIPSFLFAILLIVLFAGGNFFNIFPLRGLTSPNFSELSLFEKIIDYFWHLCLPILAMVIGGFASLTFFVKNSFIEEINKQYVTTAYAKGLKQNQVLYHHVFRNAMMIIVAGLPASLIGIFFTSSMLIEIIFSLDGLGLMGYEAVMMRDYPIIFATLYLFTLLGLVMNIISDLTYKLVDPRVNFEGKF